MLLKHGAEPDEEMKKEEYVKNLNIQLHSATKSNHIEEAKDLITKGADPDYIKDNRSLVHVAISEDNIELVRVLLDRRADPNKISGGSYGQTPLMIAAQKGFIPIFELLLSKGADPTIKNRYGYSILDYADPSHIDEIQRLIDNRETLVDQGQPAKQPSPSKVGLFARISRSKSNKINLLKHVWNKLTNRP